MSTDRSRSDTTARITDATFTLLAERGLARIKDALTQGQNTGELAPEIELDQHAVLIHHLLHGAAELAATRPGDLTRITEMTIDLLHEATQPAP